MGVNRRVYKPEFKARVALSAIREEGTNGELGTRYKVHPTQVAKWKSTALEHMAESFRDGRAVAADDGDGMTKDELYARIGRLETELDWIKKKSVQIPLKR